MPRKTIIALGGIAALVIVLVVGLSFIYSKKSNKNQTNTANVAGETSQNQSSQNTDLVDFAKYLTAQGFVMYGSYTCPHCQDQKAAFGDAFQYINYIECNSAGPNANPTACEQAGIKGVPTWIKDGQKFEGFQTIDQLKKISGYSK